MGREDPILLPFARQSHCTVPPSSHCPPSSFISLWSSWRRLAIPLSFIIIAIVLWPYTEGLCVFLPCFHLFFSTIRSHWQRGVVGSVPPYLPDWSRRLGGIGSCSSMLLIAWGGGLSFTNPTHMPVLRLYQSAQGSGSELDVWIMLESWTMTNPDSEILASGALFYFLIMLS